MAKDFGITPSRRWNFKKIRDPKVIQTYVNKLFSEIWEEGLRRLVKAMARVLTVKGLTQGGNQRGGIFSGMTASSLLPLARALKIEREIETRINSRKSPKASNHPSTPTKGEALGASAFDAFSIRGGESSSRISVNFNFTITVPQWQANEAELEALNAGIKAFKIYIDRTIQDTVKPRFRKAASQWVRIGTVPRT